MKKIICLMLSCTLLIGSTGCGNESAAARTGNQPTGINAVMEAEMKKADESLSNDTQTQDAKLSTDTQTQDAMPSADTQTQDAMPSADTQTQDAMPSADTQTQDAKLSTDGAVKTTPDAVDVDLTALSSTMVYSEVYNMMSAPESYIGKTVKMSGNFAFYHDEASGKYYFACVIKDATACCSQGIEFILPESYSYPEDYPSPGDDITVIGTFDTYQEGEETYCTLRNATLL